MLSQQWFYGGKHSFAYFGSIGKDKNGEILDSETDKAGVYFNCCVDDATPTGKCAALVSANGER